MIKNNTENKHTNRLFKEKSPYLLQHAHNPVNWFAWREEAFQKANVENKPIFLSIGYSTCHWCHVMERESFEDEEVAQFLNQHFVSVKVDREERPDVDHIYMTVCQAMTGHGGWPLTIIMTPDKKPFFAGTYFPKRSKRGMPGLLDVLESVAQKWNEDYLAIIESSENISKAIAPNFNQFKQGDIDEEILHQAYTQLKQHYDPDYGGFYDAPKFPTPHHYMFLMRYYKKYKEKYALEMVEKTLDGMYQGGMYDHIGFGFSRYSTDTFWLVPHFEKMLYDNALLAYTYLEAYQLTRDTKYAKIAEQIFTYILRDMQNPNGGFYSAEDADSEGIEGKFYVWDKKEVIEILGDRDGELFSEVYNISGKGNFEGENIPNKIKTSIEYVIRKFEFSNQEELFYTLEKAREKLYIERKKRIHPHKDDKILTSWNGLMIAALAKGAKVLHRSDYSSAAAKAIEFIYNNLINEKGRLLARYRDGEAAYFAYLDDYSFLVWGLLEQYEATFDSVYLKKVLDLNKQMKELFWDENNGGFYFYGKDAENLLVRPKEIYDGAIPSGNSVAALNLLRLAKITGDQSIEQDAEQQLKTFMGTIKRQPQAYTYFLNALWFAIGPTKEIVIAGEKQDVDTNKMLEFVNHYFLPEAIILFHPEGEDGHEIEGISTYIKDQTTIKGKATTYVCENYACQTPATSLVELQTLLNTLK